MRDPQRAGIILGVCTSMALGTTPLAHASARTSLIRTTATKQQVTELMGRYLRGGRTPDPRQTSTPAPSPTPSATTTPATTPATTPVPTSTSTVCPTPASTPCATGIDALLSGSSLTQGSVGRLWHSIGHTPTEPELQQYAAIHDVIVLNAWNTAQLARIRELNPKAIVLVYKDLSSTRSYAGAVGREGDAALLPAGVGYVQAQQHPDWFATTGNGSRIEWEPYSGHWQMAVWNARYQQTWIEQVTDEVVRNGWDGVLADNNFWTLKWYSESVLAGTNSSEQTDQRLRDGLDVMIAKAGTALNSRGKLLVPNTSDGRLDLGRWHASSAYGGSMEENFTHWGTSGADGFLTDWGPTGWVDQTAQLDVPLTLAVTHGVTGDQRTMRYAYASALVRARGRVAWSAGVPEYDDVAPFLSWQDIELGAPLGPGEPIGQAAWGRSFTRGFVAVNPTGSAVTVAVPPGFGQTRVVVPATDAVLLTKS